MLETLTLHEAARIVRESLKDKSYMELPLGRDVKAYLRVKRKRLTPASEQTWEFVLDRLVRAFPDLRVEDFETPRGTEMIEEFMEEAWGQLSHGYYNRNHSILVDFFKFYRQRGRIKGDPMLLIEKARTEQRHRTAFTDDQARAIIAGAGKRRDRIALRLLLNYGLRKGSLRAVRFKHFDYTRRRLAVFSKGGKVRNMGLPEPALWTDLERHILEIGAQPDWYLLHTGTGKGEHRIELHEKPMSNYLAHHWWYERLSDAGIVPPGTTSGEKLHKARHTAGQRILDKTKGDLKAVQIQLGHANIATTGNIYVDYDEDRQFQIMAYVLGEQDDERPAE